MTATLIDYFGKVLTSTAAAVPIIRCILWDTRSTSVFMMRGLGSNHISRAGRNAYKTWRLPVLPDGVLQTFL